MGQREHLNGLVTLKSFVTYPFTESIARILNAFRCVPDFPQDNLFMLYYSSPFVRTALARVRFLLNYSCSFPVSSAVAFASASLCLSNDAAQSLSPCGEHGSSHIELLASYPEN